VDNLTAVVPFWNGHDTIGKLLDSLPADLPVVVVDDRSDEPLHLDRCNVRVVRPEKRGYFSGAVNAGLDACQTDVLVLNQDVWLEGDAWLDLLAEKRDRFALVGDTAGKHPAWPKRYAHGTFMFMRRDAIDAVGGLNARDYPLWGATCEWQLRAVRKGFKVSLIKPKWLHHDGRGGQEPRRRLGAAITEAIKREPDKRALFLWTPPAISVVMPCYNYGHYLPDAVNSLVGGLTCLGEMPGQTFQSFEIVIVDDASTDGQSGEIGQSLADPWKGIRHVQLPQNKGTPGAINEGVRRAHGYFIHVLSADDMREPWALERLYRACLKDRRGVAYGNIRTFKGGRRGHPLRLAEYDFEQLLKRNMMPAGIMYPKKAWEEVGGYPEEMVHGREDWAFNIRLGVHGWCGVHVGESGNLCRREGQNRSVRTATNEWWRTFRQQLLNLFPEIYRGERPMRCCGGRGRRSNPSSKKVIVAGGNPGNPGHDMVPVKYVGSSSADMTWYGPVSRKTYVFGGATRYGYVDERDLATGRSRSPGLLEMAEGRRRVFQRVAAIPNPNAGQEIEPQAVIQTKSNGDLTAIQGVGPKMAAKLAEAGFATVQAIVDAPPGSLVDKAAIGLDRANKIWEAANASIA